MIRTRRVLASAFLAAAALSVGSGVALAAPPETAATPGQMPQAELVPQQAEAVTPAEQQSEGAAQEAQPADQQAQQAQPAQESLPQFSLSADMLPMGSFDMLFGSDLLGGTMNLGEEATPTA
ncbi:hypothetical protein AB8O38_14870 [Saccharomonospora xinjiangensis]|uniref:Uncharacterized protein n=1 Tax=Saccharomonospora xinjiangensis XJ-54 TaxID=882086 RepID=I0V1S8_9PSEU|nr:hypothetical protein [Saccharomonospora xinjiangensis]EID54081.1 hypothetical protein SacxiDRAFT_1840 [Saccharomonospora xinjiangensis XJ-54]